jgi:hypothetical protein
MDRLEVRVLLRTGMSARRDYSACRRFRGGRVCVAEQKREQAPRTPNASRQSVEKFVSEALITARGTPLTSTQIAILKISKKICGVFQRLSPYWKPMPSLSNVRFHAPLEICPMQLADCPISEELASTLECLGVRSFYDVHSVSLLDFRHLGDRNGSLALELGSVIRRAGRGEFGKPYSPGGAPERFASFWWKGSPGEGDEAAGSSAQTAVATDAFSIPEHARNIEISVIPMSSRLRNILSFSGLEYLGGLHAVTPKQILSLRNCGPKCLQELRHVVQGVLEGRLRLLAPRPAQNDRRVSKRFAVPPDLHCLSPYSFPISRRLDGVLRRAGIACLGDLQGMAFDELLVLTYCGPQTLRELLHLLNRLGGVTHEPCACPGRS